MRLINLLNASMLLYVLSIQLRLIKSEGQLSLSYCQSLGIQNCLTCSPQTQSGQSTCSLCTDNYALNLSQTQCIINLDQCAQVDLDNNCILCKCQYVLFEYTNPNQTDQIVMRKCVSVSTSGVSHGCAVYRIQNQQMNCIQANSNYVLKKNVQPYSVVPHNGSFCAEISSDGITCTKCQPGYQNIKGQDTCFKGTSPIYNSQMAYYDTVSQTIKPQNPTWYSDPNGVIPPILNCQFYSPITKNGPGTCESCIEGYVPSKDKSQCLQYSDSRCAYAQVDNNKKVTCSVCQSPELYYVDAQSGNCVARQNFKSQNCQILDPYIDGCLICQKDYQLLNGICFLPSDPNLLTQQNSACLFYVDSTNPKQCQICQEGYIFATNYDQCVNQISNCLVATDEYNCSLCFNFYHLYQDSQGFQKCEINTSAPQCIFSDGKVDSCQQCSNLYFLSTKSLNQQICQSITAINNCFSNDGKNNQCSLCNQGFSGSPCVKNSSSSCQNNPSNNLCTNPNFQNKYNNCCYAAPSIPNCQQQLEEECTQCKNDFYLSTDKKSCIPVNLFVSCKQSTQCSMCNPAVSPNQQCFSQKGCTTCYQPTCKTISNNLCTQCQPGYYLQNSICMQINNCQDSDGMNKICTKCKNLYYVKNQACTQITNFQNCSTSDQISDTCTKCNNLYYLDPITKKCISISINNCSTSDGLSQNCNQCQAGYFLSNLLCNQSQSNCQIYDNSQNCSQCDNFYQLSGNTCTKIQNVPSNCSQTGGIYTNCQQCINLYFLNNNICRPVNLNQCFQSDGEQQSCQKCGQSFYEKQIIPQSNQQSQFPNPYITCLQKSQIKNYIQGCKRYIDTQTVESCILCEDAYYIGLNQNNIQICILRQFISKQNCNVFSNSLSSSSSTNNQDVCDQCQNGFIPQGNSCIAIGANNIVNNCDLYKINTSQCQSCVQDNSGIQKFYLSGNQCQDISALNCKTYSNQACQECATNYQLMTNGLCVQIPIINCLNFVQSFQVQCTLCRNQYYLSANKLSCLPHDANNNPNCSEFSQSVQNQCLKCQNLYYLNSSGICVSVTMSNCLTNTINQNKCETCQTNYILTGSKSNCLQDSANSFCLQIQSETLENPICIKCQSGFSLQPSKLQCSNNINISINCVQVDANLTCVKCEDGYFLNSLSQCLSFYSVCSLVGCSQYSLFSYFDSYICSKCNQEQLYFDRGGGKCQYNPNANAPRDKGDGTFLGDGEINKIPTQVSDQKSQSAIYLISYILIVGLIFL